MSNVPEDEMAPEGGSNPAARARFEQESQDRKALLEQLGLRVVSPANEARLPQMLYRSDIMPEELPVLAEIYNRLRAIADAEGEMSLYEQALYLLLHGVIPTGSAVVSAVRSGFLPAHKYSKAAKDAFDQAVRTIQQAQGASRDEFLRAVAEAPWEKKSPE